MKLANSVALLKPNQLLRLQDVLVTAGLAFEAGGDYREIFRIEKHKHQTGVQHRIYCKLQNVTGAEIDALLWQLTRKQG